MLPLRVAKAAVTGAVITPFRAVFIEVKNSPELREVRERLRDIVGAPQLIGRLPVCPPGQAGVALSRVFEEAASS